MDIKNRTIFHGDVLEKLKIMPDECVDCIISSPPYWGLRDYGVEGQLGLEPNFKDFLKVMSKIMVQCKRVLKNTGTCWIDLGDTYAGSGKGAGGTNGKESFTFDKKPEVHETIKAKSRIGIPERFYIQCIDEGWIARNHIVWAKDNAMPSPVKDNLTNMWESIFFFAKSNDANFYYNEHTFESITTKPKSNKGGIDWTYRICAACAGGKLIKDHKKCNGNGIYRYSYWHSRDYFFNLDSIREESNPTKKPSKFEKPINTQTSLDGASTEKPKERKNANSDETIKRDHSGCYDSEGNCLNNPKGKNPGNIFYINTQPYKEAHFATFPEKLPRRILKCSCPDQVCNKCGIPRYPISKPSEEYQKTLNKQLWRKEGDWDVKKTGNGLCNGGVSGGSAITSEYVLAGFSKCNCDAGFKPGIVLDIFLGAGTTGLAAEKLGLRWCGIELNGEYIKGIRKRLDLYDNDRIGDFT